MKKLCPKKSCEFYQKPKFVTKDGFFYRKDDRRKVQRFRCKNCGARFSVATSSLECYQKKRTINTRLLELICSKVSMRRCARLLKVSPRTVELRMPYLGEKCRLKNQRQLKRLAMKSNRVQFDDLITKENSKLKPVSLSIAVDEQSRLILGAEAAQIPSFGNY